ncbi:MAG: hypothetical protein KGL39_51690 [Patescibacteria group bacterium]|nr:hypothetical protein [Patescibacteria group bacterium]
MKASDIPSKFSIPFGNGAGGSYIRAVPTASQIGVNDGLASLTDGFPPLNFQPIASGGVPPFGQDMNGILNQSTAWTRWQNAGATVPYDSAFQTLIGGYPEGAVVASTTTLGLFWYCTADDNLTNPDTGGANWLAWQVLGALSASQLFQTFLASGTYTIPSSSIKITAVGAGGGGAGTNGGATAAPSGGGAGAALIKYLSGLTVGNTLSVTIGTRGTGGGTANSGGGNGGDTIIASGTQTISTLTAGGGHAASSPTGASGAGGTATGGDINMQGNGGNAAPTGIGGVAQPYAPFGDGGGAPLNGAVINGHTQANQEGAQGIVTIEAVG